MKVQVILGALCATVTLGSCRYNDKDLWGAVNQQEMRISALEKWRASVEGQLNALQGIISAQDYVTAVEKVEKEGKQGYKLSFLKAQPVTLYYNDNNEVSGSSDAAIGFADDKDGKGEYWVVGGKPLLSASGTKVYISASAKVSLKPNAQNAEHWDLEVGDAKVTLDPNVAKNFPVKAIREEAGKVLITLQDNSTKELVKWVDVNSAFLAEYVKTEQGQQTYTINLPEGFTMMPLKEIPSSWTITVTGSGANTQLAVTFPSSGELQVPFHIYADGKAGAVTKVLTFKVSAQGSTAVHEIAYNGSAISIPEGVERVKITGTTTAPRPFGDHIGNVIKSHASVKFIDLSDFVHSAAITANAFSLKNNSSDPNHASNHNNVIEHVILPRNHNGRLFNEVFRNCKKLHTVVFLTNNNPNFGTDVFTGCDALEHIYVPEDKVDAYKALANLSAAHKEKISALPAEYR